MLRAVLIVVLFVAAQGASVPAPAATGERIVGGREVSILKHPHQISLRRRSTVNNAYTHTCGGSIYKENIVLTAAHCVNGRYAENFTVVAGTNNRAGSDGVVVRVNKIVMHEDYNGSLYINDIAMLFLSSPLPLNGITIAPVTLADVHPSGGNISTITGWGTTSSGGSSSNKLMEVDVPIVSNAECDVAYGGNRITDDMLCAGLVGIGGKDACQGDSGGPLLVGGKLAGIVSWGYACALADYPGVYASVAYFQDWIAATIEENMS